MLPFVSADHRRPLPREAVAARRKQPGPTPPADGIAAASMEAHKRRSMHSPAGASKQDDRLNDRRRAAVHGSKADDGHGWPGWGVRAGACRVPVALGAGPNARPWMAGPGVGRARGCAKDGSERVPSLVELAPG